jgi:hypothetical protein
MVQKNLLEAALEGIENVISLLEKIDGMSTAAFLYQRA